MSEKPRFSAFPRGEGPPSRKEQQEKSEAERYAGKGESEERIGRGLGGRFFFSLFLPHYSITWPFLLLPFFVPPLLRPSLDGSSGKRKEKELVGGGKPRSDEWAGEEVRRKRRIKKRRRNA